MSGADTLETAVIYTRVSTAEQVSNMSLPTQAKSCKQYCVKEGIEVDRLFEEDGASGRSTDRTRLQEMLEYCRKNKRKITHVVVHHSSRFARNQHDHLALRAVLKKYGITLRSATEPI